MSSTVHLPDPDRPLAAIVMAAGDADGMRSNRPKPLHRLCGRTLVGHALDALSHAGAGRAVVVVGQGGDRVAKTLQQEAPSALPNAMPIEFVIQAVPRGTGDAVAVALTGLDDEIDDVDGESDLLVIPGDRPLFRASTLAELVAVHRETGAAATVLTMHLNDPRGFGRIVRGRGGRIEGIVEHDAADEEQQEITEVNTSVYCFRSGLLAPALRRIVPNDDNLSDLTDVIAVLHDAGYQVRSHELLDTDEASGVEDRLHLAQAEAELRRRTNSALMANGVTMLDPERTYVDATVILGTDVTLFPGTLLQGRTVIGAGAEIGPDSRLVDCTVGEAAVVEQTVARGATIGAGAVVGPFAALEPGSQVAAGVRTGPFFRGD